MDLVPPNVTSLVTNQSITAIEGENITLSFEITNASPPVLTPNVRWFYTADFASSLFANGSKLHDITGQNNRTSASTLLFSSNRLTLTVSNIVQARTEGEETDQGRYFLQAINEAGVDSSYIDVILLGKQTDETNL